jgi:hypothetical protein
MLLQLLANKLAHFALAVNVIRRAKPTQPFQVIEMAEYYWKLQQRTCREPGTYLEASSTR